MPNFTSRKERNAYYRAYRLVNKKKHREYMRDYMKKYRRRQAGDK